MKKLSFLFAMLLSSPAFADIGPPRGDMSTVDVILIVLIGLAVIVFLATSLVIYNAKPDNLDLGMPKHVPPYRIPPRPRQ